MSIPCHVAEIAPAHVRLAGDCKALLSALRQSRYADALFRDAQLRPCVRVDAGNPLASDELAALLAWLAAEGSAMLELYGEPFGPAEVARALQATGGVGAFSSLIVRAPDDWSLIEHSV